MRLNALIIALTLSLASVAAQADPFDKGLNFYINGDHANALKIWRPLADRGHATAQFHLGHMYRHGQGVEQDNAKALEWYRKAAAQGHKTAVYRVRLMEIEQRKVASIH